jgi:hypothetical protein
MSFGLVVLAVNPGATDIAVRAMAERCQSLHHPEGELDERIVGFYENLRARYADFPPYAHDSPWMDTPLNIGIDHVSMYLSFSERSTAALQVIDQLACRYDLTIYDPQGDEVTRPTDVRTPVDPAIVALIEELRAPDC